MHAHIQTETTDRDSYTSNNYKVNGRTDLTTALSQTDILLAKPTSEQCSRIRIFRFFQISKKHDFLRFFGNDVSKSRKKSSAKV